MTTTQGGKTFARLYVATSENWKDKRSGERREQTEWHRVVIFNEGLASVAERFLRKGSNVFLQGKLQTRKWQDQSGNDRYSTEVVLSAYDGKLTMLDGKPADGDRQQRDTSSAAYKAARDGTGAANAPMDLDDDIPF